MKILQIYFGDGRGTTPVIQDINEWKDEYPFIVFEDEGAIVISKIDCKLDDSLYNDYVFKNSTLKA